jgi:flagellum-specific peptidoglycan hydrolase FlgJ
MTREYQREYYKTHKDQILKRHRERYATDPEYRDKIKTSVAQAKRDKYANDPEHRQKILDRNKAYRDWKPEND